MLRKRKGQSTVEYILLVTGVIAVLIFFATSKTSGIQKHINESLDTATDKMADKEGDLTSSQYDASNAKGSTGTPTISVQVNGDLL